MIVDDHAVVRRGVRAYLEALDDMAVAAEAADGQDALDQLGELAARGPCPTWCCLTCVMPRMDGVQAAALITSRYPTIRVVILTSFGEMERVHARWPAAPSATCSRTPGPPRWPPRSARPPRDGTYLDPAIARRLTREISAPRSGLTR